MLAKAKKVRLDEAAAAFAVPLDGPEPAHRACYISLLVFGVVLLGASAWFAHTRTMPGWEQTLFYKVNDMHLPHIVTTLAKQLSNAVWGLVGLIGLALLIPRFRLRAWQYAVAVGSAFVVEYGLEQIIDRPRPVGILHHLTLRAQQSGPGFPSGHETALAALVLTMWFFVAWPWRILLVLLLIAEGWARVFLGVHGPLDIVGGVAVSSIVVGVLHLAPVKWRRFFKLA